MADERRATLRQRLLAILVTGIGAATASAVSFAMAVYEAANPEPVPVAAIGETIDTGRWTVVFHEARVGAVPSSAVAPPERKTFLAVEFELENRSAASSPVSSNLIAIDPSAPGLQEPAFRLVRDEWLASALNPGMRERMIAVWEWPEERSPPQEVRLVVGGQIYKRRDNLYGASNWFDGDPVAVVELPVTRGDAEAAR